MTHLDKGLTDSCNISCNSIFSCVDFAWSSNWTRQGFHRCFRAMLYASDSDSISSNCVSRFTHEERRLDDQTYVMQSNSLHVYFSPNFSVEIWRFPSAKSLFLAIFRRVIEYVEKSTSHKILNRYQVFQKPVNDHRNYLHGVSRSILFVPIHSSLNNDL